MNWNFGVNVGMSAYQSIVNGAMLQSQLAAEARMRDQFEIYMRQRFIETAPRYDGHAVPLVRKKCK